MKEILYVERLTQEVCREKVYGDLFLRLLYGTGWMSRLVAPFLLPLIATIPFFSHMYGWLQRRWWSRYKIRRFIDKYHIDEREFLKPISHFASFDAFFTRALTSAARPLAQGEDVVILPADGRYLVFSNMQEVEKFWIKSRPFDIEALLQNRELALHYAGGSMVIARLAPVDYHRFHFPCDAIPEEPRCIPGPLYSVNPKALKKNIAILWENKREIVMLHTKRFGSIACIAVGATYVGTIHHTFTPKKLHAKGQEMGYFSFGGSSLVLLFEQGKIVFDRDLVANTKNGLETRGLMGQSLGKL